MRTEISYQLYVQDDLAGNLRCGIMPRGAFCLLPSFIKHFENVLRQRPSLTVTPSNKWPLVRKAQYSLPVFEIGFHLTDTASAQHHRIPRPECAMVLKPPIRSLRHANADIVLGVLASEQYKRKGRITCQSKLQLAQNGPERLIMRSENFG